MVRCRCRRELIREDEKRKAEDRLETLLYSFVDADFGKTTPEQFCKSLPASVSYPALKFPPPVGAALYDQWLAKRLPPEGS